MERVPLGHHRHRAAACGASKPIAWTSASKTRSTSSTEGGELRVASKRGRWSTDVNRRARRGLKEELGRCTARKAATDRNRKVHHVKPFWQWWVVMLHKIDVTQFYPIEKRLASSWGGKHHGEPCVANSPWLTKSHIWLPGTKSAKIRSGTMKLMLHPPTEAWSTYIHPSGFSTSTANILRSPHATSVRFPHSG